MPLQNTQAMHTEALLKQKKLKRATGGKIPDNLGH